MPRGGSKGLLSGGRAATGRGHKKKGLAGVGGGAGGRGRGEAGVGKVVPAVRGTLYLEMLTRNIETWNMSLSDSDRLMFRFQCFGGAFC